MGPNSISMSVKRGLQPELVVFAGPNGSGKSTMTVPPWIKGQYINADDIQQDQEIDNLTAAKKAEALREACVRRRETFTFETVLSTDRNLDLMLRAKDAGYFIRGYFILTCDPMLNVARVSSRVNDGGHDVPVDKIISRYHKSLQNLPRFVSLCDICHVYDNTIDAFRIFRKHKSSLTLYENNIWSFTQVHALIFGR